MTFCLTKYTLYDILYIPKKERWRKHEKNQVVSPLLACIAIFISFASCGGEFPASSSTMGNESEADQPQTPIPDSTLNDPSMVLVDVLPFETEYLGTFTMLSYQDGLLDYVKTPWLMESAEDIATFIDDMDDDFSMSGFVTFSAQYDDAYFAEKILVITLSKTSSCCIPSIAKVTYEPSTGNLTVCRDTVHEGYDHNEDDRQDFLFVEISRPTGQIQSVTLNDGDFGTPVVKKYTVRNVVQERMRFDSFDAAVDYFSKVDPDEIQNEQLKQTVTKILERGYLYRVTAEGYETKDYWALLYSADTVNVDVDPCSVMYLSDGTVSRRLYINYPSEHDPYVPSQKTMADYFALRYDMDLFDLDGVLPAVKHSVLSDVIIHRTSAFYGPIAVKAEIDDICYLDVEDLYYSDAEVNAFIESLQFEKVYFEREQSYDDSTDPNVTLLPTNTVSFERSSFEPESERPFGPVLFNDAKTAAAYLKDVVVWEKEAYAQYCQKYDEAFFENHFLIAYIEITSTCCRFDFRNVGLVENEAEGTSQMTLFIGRHEDIVHNEDVRYIINLIEVETTEPITDISQLARKFYAK